MKNFFFASEKEHNSNRFIFILTCIIALSIGIYALIGLVEDNRIAQDRRAHKKALIQNEVLNLQKNQGLMPIKDALFITILNELKSDSLKISTRSIEAISELSRSYEPYEKWSNDSLTTFKISPERGRLLNDIIQLALDSTSLDKIINTTTFAYSQIFKAKLEGANLANIDLTGCHLREANLSFSNLRGAKMKGADLWKSNLEGVQLSNAKLNKSNLSWSQMSKAVLYNAKLDGSNLNNAILNNAQLKNASIKNAQLQFVKCKQSDLTNVNLFESDLTKSDMSNSNLRNANLGYTDWTDASLKGTDLTGGMLRKAIFKYTDLSEVTLLDVFVRGIDWFDKLNNWQTVGADEIREKYKLLEEPTYPSNYILKDR
ncbi:MAG: pentapeptide repeat-containing protein [Saprospiraceae bacterium]|nr:pentapeptide repeat-containing protein [Saprospiraceae bacterium]